MTLLPASSSTVGPAPDRRTLLRGAVWTIPAISLATSVPAYAASSVAAPPRVTAALFWPPTEEEVALGAEPLPEGWTMGFVAQFAAADNRDLAEPLQLVLGVPEAWRGGEFPLTGYMNAGPVDVEGRFVTPVVGNGAVEGVFGRDGELAMAAGEPLEGLGEATVLLFLKIPAGVVYDDEQSFSLTVWPPAEGLSVGLGSVMTHTDCFNLVYGTGGDASVLPD